MRTAIFKTIRMDSSRIVSGYKKVQQGWQLGK